jgi:lipopolysaccharide heptosyltransferase II
MQRLQGADKFLGAIACVLLQPLRLVRMRKRPARAAHRILLIKFWGIGSLQLLTPAVAALRRQQAGARLTLLTLLPNEEFARGLGVFDDVRTLDLGAASGAGGWCRLFLRIARLVLALRRARFDRVYDFEFFTRFSALVSLASAAPETFGFSAPRVWRGSFHVRTVPFNRYWHVARNFRALAGGEDGEGVRSLAPFPLLADDQASVLSALERAGVAADRPLAVLNPNAGILALERRWPAASFAALARRLCLEGIPVVFVGSAEEREHVAAIVRAVGRVPAEVLADLSGKLSIGELAALLARAGTHVTNDTGPMHIGAALGAPTVALFGPETPVMYAPIGRRVVALWRPPPCSPCINVHENKVLNCVRGIPECLTNISVDAVFAAARAQLEAPRHVQVTGRVRA